MRYNEHILLKNGQTALLRNGVKSDGAAVLEVFNLAHEETDYLLSYPDENSFNAEQEGEFLERKAISPNEIEIVAIVNDKIVGTAGIDAIGSQYKVRHRTEFGINILKAYWGVGIGHALLNACIACAKEAGYTQMELSVVAENTNAIALYQKKGFVEYGRNPKGFYSRFNGFQEIVLMRLTL